MKLPAFLSSRYFHYVLGFVVSAVALIWVYLITDWGRVAGFAADMEWFWFLPISVLLLLHFFLRALRWRYLLPGAKQSSLRLLFDSIMLGNFATFLLPLRAGEFVRPFLLSREGKLPFARCFASVVVERFFDLAAVLFCFSLFLGELKGLPPAFMGAAWSLGSLALLLFSFLLVGSFFPNLVWRILGFFLKPLPEKLGKLFEKLASDVLEGTSVLRSGSASLKVLVLTALIWVSNYLLFYAFFELFQFESSFFLSMSVAVIIALAVALPSAPGFLGVFQAATIVAFELFGLGSDQAVAFSIVNHVYQYLVFMLYGAFLLSKYHLGLRQLEHQEERVQA